MSDRDSPRLADGMEARKPEDLFRRLEELGISTKTIEHPPVFTVDEAKALRGEIEGCHTKNLFLRNKKGAMWLLVCPEDRSVDLKSLATRLGTGRLSFGNAERLMDYLGVIPGAVSPFAILNDGAFVTSEKGVPRVKLYDRQGRFVAVVAGTDQFRAGTEGLDLAGDASGRIYVLDPARKAVRVFSKTQVTPEGTE